MKSKLTYIAYLFPLLAMSLIIVSAKIIIDNYPIDFLKLRWIDYFMTILFSVTLVWLIKFETLRKLIFIEITDKQIVIQNIFFSKRNISKNDLVGFETQIESTRLGNFEETKILIKNGSRIILSEFFIDNYKDIKNNVTNNLKDHGGARKNAL
ncbi:hypothetical protein SYJ56_21345 [Algoriphagus sp. D3-2-R+10]|uniref:hypothetical protein n=1 Tax=Algoriphagus aurantiacus TaxID=3103948 RepID=UPI002B383035|nr:hypothetical protein [Algoriphagus sp. D3-2-R+10]MEB2777873.1 hypothetical protein [Algoriphagus sp. D3-2-R+10]